jgi:beta-lactam-binding protein with PASTA domain
MMKKRSAAAFAMASVGAAAAIALVPGVASAASNVTVPNVVGLTSTQAISALTAAGLHEGTVTIVTVTESIDGNKVRAESPGAGSSVPAGSAINLTITQWNGTRH